MTYKMFLDDERFPTTKDWVIVRTVDEAVIAVHSLGFPSCISFDHDLGETHTLCGYDNTGMGFARWITDNALDKNITIPLDFEFYVHSQNPIGARNIQNLLSRFLPMYNKEYISELDDSIPQGLE